MGCRLQFHNVLYRCMKKFTFHKSWISSLTFVEWFYLSITFIKATHSHKATVDDWILILLIFPYCIIFLSCILFLYRVFLRKSTQKLFYIVRIKEIYKPLNCFGFLFQIFDTGQLIWNISVFGKGVFKALLLLQKSSLYNSSFPCLYCSWDYFGEVMGGISAAEWLYRQKWRDWNTHSGGMAEDYRIKLPRLLWKAIWACKLINYINKISRNGKIDLSDKGQ